MPERRKFSPDEDNFIRSNYRSMLAQDIATHLGRALHQIRKRAVRIGVAKPLKRWNAADDEIILAAWQCRQLRDVARQLQRRCTEVSQRAKRLGIKRWRSHPRPITRGGYLVSRWERSKSGKLRAVPVHRDVMEQHLGRPMRRGESVHHINADKHDNRIENLFLCANRAIHRSAHMSVERLLPVLLERGIIQFNRAQGIYELCATIK